MLDKWMKLNYTDPDMRECIYEFSMGCRRLLMEEICTENSYDKRYKVMARAQDSIGWRRFMEGMVCKEIRAIQHTHSSVTGLRCNTERWGWGRELVTYLLEVTHGQWLYPNVQVHDRITGMLTTHERRNYKWK
jgi:hypothetical protein